MKRIILIGPGASGKDFLKKKMISRGYKPSISYTTREPRLNEKEGEDYYFISEEQFISMIDRNEFKEWNKFAGKWYYGTTKVHFDAASLFIMTPSGINKLTQDERVESLVIYLDLPEDVRRERLNKRKDADNTERRLETDRADFKDFNSFDIRIRNSDF